MVKGIVLLNLVFLVHFFIFSIHNVFVKCKYCSLVGFFLLFFVGFGMKPKGESAYVAN